MAIGVTVRRAVADDAAAAAALRRIVFPYKVMTAEAIRRSVTRDRAQEKFLPLAAERDGQLVGFGTAGLNIFTSTAGRAQLSAFVHPEHRGLGIGSSLVEQLHEHLADAGARQVQAFVQQESADFARHRRYDGTRQMHYSGVELSMLPTRPSPSPGIDLRTYDEIDPRAVYAAEMIASLDEPTDAPMDSIDYQQWLTDFWNDPAVDRSLSVAALAGDEVLSFTITETDADRLWSAFSGTVPEHRGRGLSKLVKSDALRRAAAAGVRSAYTSNDDRNGPMLAINDWLGYRRVATEFGLVRDF
jgi:GNAT superfamily N-acetyltransferase